MLAVLDSDPGADVRSFLAYAEPSRRCHPVRAIVERTSDATGFLPWETELA